MIRKRSSLVALTLALCLVLGQVPCSWANAAPTRISGRVFASNLVSPAANLTVQAVREGEKVVLTQAITDKNGRFTMSGMEAGPLVLVFLDRQGQPLAATKVTAKTGENSEVTLALPDPSKQAPAAAGTHGIWAWLSTPAGATAAVVASAVVLGVAANQVTKTNSEQPPVSPSRPR